MICVLNIIYKPLTFTRFPIERLVDVTFRVSTSLYDFKKLVIISEQLSTHTRIHTRARLVSAKINFAKLDVELLAARNNRA